MNTFPGAADAVQDRRSDENGSEDAVDDQHDHPHAIMTSYLEGGIRGLDGGRGGAGRGAVAAAAGLGVVARRLVAEVEVRVEGNERFRCCGIKLKALYMKKNKFCFCYL